MVGKEPSAAWLLSRRVLLGIYVFLLVAALGYFAHRGPYRCFVLVCPDLPVFFTSGIAWVSGDNPYDAQVLNRILYDEGGPPHARSQMLINPPFSLPWFALLSFFSFPVVNFLIVGANLLLVSTIAWSLSRLLADQTQPSWARAVFVLLVLAWAPLHTSISQGQNTLLVMAMLIGGVRLVQSGRQCIAGIVFAVAGTIRPSFFVVLALWYAFSIRRCVRLVGSAMVVALLVSVIAVGRLEWADVPWRESFGENLEAFVQDDGGPFGEGTGSISPARPARFIMLNLQPLMSTWWGRGPLTDYLPQVMAVMVVAVVWWLHRRRADGQTEEKMGLIDLSILSVLTLLPAYNRFYSAVLLLVPLSWALSAWNRARCRWLARGTALLLMVFLVPGTAMLLELLPNEILQSWWCDAMLLPHQTYCLILVLVLLLLASWRQTETVGDSRGVPPESSVRLVTKGFTDGAEGTVASIPRTTIMTAS
jgi:hypothetical protein